MKDTRTTKHQLIVGMIDVVGDIACKGINDVDVYAKIQRMRDLLDAFLNEH